MVESIAHYDDYEFSLDMEWDTLLLHITNHLSLARSLDEAFERFVNITSDLIGVQRGSIFLNDESTGELFTRIALGHGRREIRVLNSSGIGGWVFHNGEPVLIKDAYEDERFDNEVDKRTGFKTKNMLCVPLRTLDGKILGVAQLLNKKRGNFTKKDLQLFESITEQAAIALHSFLVIEEIEENRKQELEFLEVVSQVSTELQLNALLQKIITTISKMLDAERTTLFINDEKTNELYTEIGEGLGAKRIRFPNHMGIAGSVFTTAETIKIPHAYADLRFNPSFDKTTGFFTRSILCMPVFNKAGNVIGVTQVLNKRGEFTKEDEARLAAFTSQIALGIENAKLFDDVQNIKNYNEGILESMSNGVITVDQEGLIVTCNNAGLQILGVEAEDILNKQAAEFFDTINTWIVDKVQLIASAEGQDDSEVIVDAPLELQGESKSANITVTPLIGVNSEKLGSMILLEDISNEKRMKSTMSRYMDPDLAEKLMGGNEEILGGINSEATILFSDIRSFTTITEEVGAEGTVTLLNEYFTLMVDCIQNEGGMLDKFVGDAMMAVFGTPFPNEDDVDRAVRAAIEMMRQLKVLNDRRTAQGLMAIDHGMGINTDHVVSGNIGSPKRMDYTVIGDGVNLAARLESACKQYGAHILVSESTFKQLKGTYRAREVDLVVVKGKTEPVSVYEIVDYHDDQSFPHPIEVLGHFKNGLEHYRKANWKLATKSFEEALAANPNDKASSLYVERCAYMEANPPEGEWDGIWVMKTK